MKIGISIRNMGPQSSRDMITACAVAADQAQLDSLWITEHIAISPDNAEGSEGRYLDPLITLSFLAAKTETIKLGTGVLILPYRPAVITSKLVMTLQELASGRLKLGVGIGWMKSEFKALGLDLRHRVRDSHRVLRFLNEAFDNDIVRQNGEEFIVSPRPERPPVLMGGSAPHAISRAINYGDGWLPMGLKPEALAPLASDYKIRAVDAGKTSPEVVVFTRLPLGESVSERARCEDLIGAYEKAGATSIVHGQKYTVADELIDSISNLAQFV